MKAKFNDIENREKSMKPESDTLKRAIQFDKPLARLTERGHKRPISGINRCYPQRSPYRH